MQLTLLDIYPVQYTFKNGRLSFRELPVRPVPSSKLNEACGSSDNDYLLQSLASEILTGEDCHLQVDLQFWWNDVSRNELGHSLQVACTNPANNILQKLCKRFHDDVKISVSVVRPPPIFTSGTTETICWIEGMEINNTSYMCEARDLHWNNAYHPERLVGHFLFNMQIVVTASIPDENLPSMKKINIPQTILESGLANDVVIIAENGTEIKAHKNFLFAWSTTFQAMFQSGLEESQTGRLDMTDMSESGINAFLRYLYYQDLEEPNDNADIAYELLYAAHKYEVTVLEAIMMKQLLKRTERDFNAQLAFKIYSFVRNIQGAAKLKSKMIEILKMKLDEVHALPEYKELFQKNPDDAMELSYQLAKTALK